MTDIGTHQNPEAVKLNHDSVGRLSQVTLSTPVDHQNHVVAVTAGVEIVTNFDFANVAVEKAGAHLIFRFPEGGSFTLENINTLISDDQSPTIVLQDGTVVSAGQILASIVAPESEIEPAAGESGQPSGGVSDYQDNPGSILDGVEKLDGLDFSEIGGINPLGHRGLEHNRGDAAGPGISTTDAAAPGIHVNDVGETRDATPTITGTAGPGSTIIIEVGDVTLTTSADADGNWSVTIPESTPLPDGGYTITGTATDSAGNFSTHTGSLSVDTTAIATITLDADITANDVIDAGELGGDISISGTVGGDAQQGDIVTLTVNGSTYTGTVADSAFSIDVPATELAADPDSTIEATITVTDPLGNTFTAADTETYNSNPTNTIAIVNDPSVAADDTATTVEEQSVSIDVLA
ncbi:MAG: Ig-like domain-containing protein, partial [Desulfobacteraceae bacterium]